MDCSMPGFPVHHQLPEVTQTPLSWWCHPTISSSVVPFSSHLQSFPASRSFPVSQVFTSGGQSFSLSSSNEYSGLISFGIDWLDLLVVQGALRGLLQYHSSKTSILWHSAFFMVQLLHPYMTTGKTIALTRWTFVGKVMPLLFNTLSRLVIAVLPRSNHVLISRLQSPSAVILDVLVTQSCPTLCDPTDYSLPGSSIKSLDKNTGVGCCSHLQGVFPTQGSNLGFLHCRPILYCLSYQGSPSDFGVQENKVCHCFHCFPIYLLWSDGTGCHDLSFLNVEF